MIMKLLAPRKDGLGPKNSD